MSLVFRSSLAFRSTRTLPSTSRAILERSISRTKTLARVLPRVDAQIQVFNDRGGFRLGADAPSRSLSARGLSFRVGDPRIGPHLGGADRDRTDDLRLAKPALSQLSYSPEECAGPEAPPHFGGGPGQTRTADLTLIRRVL